MAQLIYYNVVVRGVRLVVINAIGALQVQHRADNEGLPDRAQLKAAISEMKQRA